MTTVSKRNGTHDGRYSLVHVAVSGTMTWHVLPDDPPLWRLSDALDGWSMVNPWLKHGVDFGFPSFHGAQHYFVDDRLFVGNDDLLLVPPDSINGKAAMELAMRELPVFLRRLRLLSRQASFPDKVASVATSESAYELHDCPVPERGTVPVHLFRCPAGSPVARGHVEQAEGSHDPPPYLTLVLDAIRAFQASDWQLAVLYAAMSTEVAANCAIEGAFAELRLDPARAHRLRLVVDAQSGALTDPVYRALRSRRPNFRELLEIQPLYVLGRSLLAEKPDLYRRATRLYRTRNKIVHEGNAAGDDCLELTEGGGSEAIDAAIGVVGWFGLEAGFDWPLRVFQGLGVIPPCTGEGRDAA